MPKPKPKSAPPHKLLTIQVRDHEDFAEFCLNLLGHGYDAWLGGDGRLPLPGPPPIHSDLSWPEWRKVFTKIARRWWEDYTDFNEPKPGPRNMQGRCFRAIHLALAPLGGEDYSTVPSWNGRPLSVYRLAELMADKDPDLSVQVCRKYARLWLVYRKLSTPALLTPRDLAVLERLDDNMFHVAQYLLSQSAPHK